MTDFEKKMERLRKALADFDNLKIMESYMTAPESFMFCDRKRVVMNYIALMSDEDFKVVRKALADNREKMRERVITEFHTVMSDWSKL